MAWNNPDPEIREATEHLVRAYEIMQEHGDPEGMDRGPRAYLNEYKEEGELPWDGLHEPGEDEEDLTDVDEELYQDPEGPHFRWSIETDSYLVSDKHGLVPVGEEVTLDFEDGSTVTVRIDGEVETQSLTDRLYQLIDRL